MPQRRRGLGLSYEVKTLIVIILLFFAYPVGLILMFMWMDWSAWIKALILLPVVCLILMIIFMTTATHVSVGMRGW
jgi:cytochrome c oxidase subunit IV